MKREVLMADTSASLEIADGQVIYRRDSEELRRSYSLVELTPGCYSVLLDGRAFRVSLASGGAIVNGRAIALEVVNPRDMRTGHRGQTQVGRQNIIASMPGKVVRVLVGVGDSVELGQGLVVVEAMKMQNEMKSPKAGAVVEIRTRADAVVGAGDILLMIE
ncbi:MAG: biotin/lipoyl-containing protein [Acidobacteriota bacterium]